MTTFQYDRQYRYLNRLVVYRGSPVFPTFRFLDDGSEFYVEVDNLHLIEAVNESEQEARAADPDFNPYQPVTMPQYVPTLPVLPTV